LRRSVANSPNSETSYFRTNAGAFSQPTVNKMLRITSLFVLAGLMFASGASTSQCKTDEHGSCLTDQHDSSSLLQSKATYESISKEVAASEKHADVEHDIRMKQYLHSPRAGGEMRSKRHAKLEQANGIEQYLHSPRAGGEMKQSKSEHATAMKQYLSSPRAGGEVLKASVAGSVSEGGDECYKGSGACSTCVETQDTWCSYNTWDSYCYATCDGPTYFASPGCESMCSGGEVPDTATSVSGGDVIVSGGDSVSGGGDECQKGSGACSTCVETQDTWCSYNAWDSYCYATCEGPTWYASPGCASMCGLSLVDESISGHADASEKHVDVERDIRAKQYLSSPRAGGEMLKASVAGSVSEGDGVCYKGSGACSTCVETQDTWCSYNTWDSYCYATCDGPTWYASPGCASMCGPTATGGDLPISGGEVPISGGEVSGGGDVCSKGSGACSTCVETQDPWCSYNSWDSYCYATCDGPTSFASPGCESMCA
jgi:hypothetical protein